MKSKFYKYGIAALVGVSALALAGCQRNENSQVHLMPSRNLQ